MPKKKTSYVQPLSSLLSITTDTVRFDRSIEAVLRILAVQVTSEVQVAALNALASLNLPKPVTVMNCTFNGAC